MSMNAVKIEDWSQYPDSYQLDEFSKSIDVDPSLFLPADKLEAHYERSWKLYTDMGSPKTVCAPMVNQSELPFRMLVRKYGAELCYTPMIHSLVFIRSPKNWTKMFGTNENDKPLIAQICGDDPMIVLNAAKKLQDRVNAIDLNLGCPQGIAKKGHYGSFLLPDTRLVQKIVRTLHDNLTVPVTVKIRILQDDPTGMKTMALGRALQNSGASIITLHGRTRDNTKTNIGGCNFDMIRRLKAEVRIPVFANGGIGNIYDIKEAKYITKADAIMVSEALLTWPAIFGFENPEQMPDPVDLGSEFILINRQYPGWEGCMRPHIFKFLFRELAIHTGVRHLLGAPKIAGDLLAVMNAIRKEQFDMYELHLSNPALYSPQAFIAYADIFAEGKKHLITPHDDEYYQEKKEIEEEIEEETKKDNELVIPPSEEESCCYGSENESSLSLNCRDFSNRYLLSVELFDTIASVLSSILTYNLPKYSSRKEIARSKPVDFPGQDTIVEYATEPYEKYPLLKKEVPAEMRAFLNSIYNSRVHWYDRYFSHRVPNNGSRLKTMLDKEEKENIEPIRVIADIKPVKTFANEDIEDNIGSKKSKIDSIY